MGWDAEDVTLLKNLWSRGQSAEQIARRLGYGRNAVSAKLTRLSLKRGHKPPTAKPKIRPVPRPRSVLLAACARPVDKVVSREPVAKQGIRANGGSRKPAATFWPLDQREIDITELTKILDQTRQPVRA